MRQLKVNDTALEVFEAGSGPPILFVHGFPVDHRMWRGQLDELAEDFQVIAPDLRGFGNSRAVSGTVTMEQFADDLAELLVGLDIRQPVTLCGLSMGGYIAWQFWRRHAQRLSRLILCDTRSAADTEQAASARIDLAQQVLDKGSKFLAQSMIPKLFSDQTRRHRPAVVRATEEMIDSCPAQTAAAALRGMAQRQDATGWLGQIDVPTLVICGQQDALTSVTEMQGIAAAMPQAELAVIPACGHMAPLEDPVHVNKAMRRFLGAPKS